MLVDAFIVGQFATHVNSGVNFLPNDRRDVQHDATIVQQQTVAGGDVIDERFVVAADALAAAAIGI